MEKIVPLTQLISEGKPIDPADVFNIGLSAEYFDPISDSQGTLSFKHYTFYGRPMDFVSSAFLATELLDIAKGLRDQFMNSMSNAQLSRLDVNLTHIEKELGDMVVKASDHSLSTDEILEMHNEYMSRIEKDKDIGGC